MARHKIKADVTIKNAKPKAAIYRLSDGDGLYVSKGAPDDRPMSDNTVLAALRRMGFAKDEMSDHGFRAMARTILDEVLGCARTSSNTSLPTPCAIRTGALTTAPRTLPNAGR